jgi:SOS response regulatory protein OraA/RecX
MGPGGPRRLQTVCGGPWGRWVGSIPTHSRDPARVPIRHCAAPTPALPTRHEDIPDHPTSATRARAGLPRRGGKPRFEIALDLLLRAGLAVGDTCRPSGRRARGRGRGGAGEEAPFASWRTDPAPPGGPASPGAAGTPGPLVEGTVAWLDERGYLDDRAFAEMFVRDRLRFRPRGQRALVQELVSKGVAPATAEAAVTAVLGHQETREADLAVEAARAWERRNASVLQAAATSSDHRRRARQRLYGHLVRRGSMQKPSGQPWRACSNGKIDPLPRPPVASGHAQSQDHPEPHRRGRPRARMSEHILVGMERRGVRRRSSPPPRRARRSPGPRGGPGRCGPRRGRGRRWHGPRNRQRPAPALAQGVDGPVLGVLPVGSGNDFAKLIGPLDDLERSMDILVDGKLRRFDAAHAAWDRREHWFINAAGTGIDVEVVRQILRKRGRPHPA